MSVRRISFQSVPVDDQDRAVAFYRDGLGWATRFAWGGDGQPRGIALAAGGIDTMSYKLIYLARRNPGISVKLSALHPRYEPALRAAYC